MSEKITLLEFKRLLEERLPELRERAERNIPQRIGFSFAPNLELLEPQRLREVFERMPAMGVVPREIRLLGLKELVEEALAAQAVLERAKKQVKEEKGAIRVELELPEEEAEVLEEIIKGKSPEEIAKLLIEALKRQIAEEPRRKLAELRMLLDMGGAPFYLTLNKERLQLMLPKETIAALEKRPALRGRLIELLKQFVE